MKLAADEEEYESSLEAELRSKLELTRVVRCGRTAEESPITSPLAERINVSEKWRNRRFIETISEVEDLADQVEPEAFAEPDRTR